MADAPVEVFEIARCPEHGLHGQRSRCFVCHGDVEQTEMVAKADYDRVVAALRAVRDYRPPTKRVRAAVVLVDVQEIAKTALRHTGLQHEWFNPHRNGYPGLGDYESCRRCGAVKNERNGDKAECRGRVRVGPR